MNKIFIGLAQKLLILEESANGYSFSTHLEGLKVNRMTWDPKDKDHLFVGTNQGLWKSKDGGKNWERADQGIRSENITAIAVHPKKRMHGQAVLYAGTEPSALYYSINAGQTWKEFKGIQELPSKRSWSYPPQPDTHLVRWITPSYADENFIGVSIEAGAIVYTNDFGKTWNDRTEKGPRDVHTLLKHPDAPARLYAANGGSLTHPMRAYAESDDGGQSWQYKSEGLEKHPYLYNLALHPNDPNLVLASASESASRAHREQRYSTIYRKLADEPWEEWAEGLPKEGAYTHHLTNDPHDVDGFYALNNFGLFYLARGQEKWQEMPIPWPDGSLKERAYMFRIQNNH